MALTSNSEIDPASARFDRGAWAVLALALMIIGVNIALILTPLLLPGDGWAYTELDSSDQGAWVAVQSLTSRPTPLLPGDRIFAIDGQSMSARLDAAFALRPARPNTWVEGGSARYEIVRGGQSLPLDVPLLRLTAREILFYLVFEEADVFVSLFLPLTFVIALIVFWRRPQLTAARLLLLFGAAVAVGYIQAPPTSNALMYAGVVVLPYLVSPWQLVLLPALLHLLLVFPMVKWPLRERPVLPLILLYGLGQAAIWIAWLANWGRASQFLGLYFVIVGAQALTQFAAMLASLAHSWLTVRGAIPRAQLGWMTVGLSVGFIGSSLLWMLLTLFSMLDSALGWLPEAMLLALPLGLAIAILRYRLFDIGVVINRALVYVSLTALLLLAYFGTVVVLQSVLRFITGAAQSQLVTVLSTLGIAALFTPLRARLQTVIDRRFYRRKYNTARILGAFSATLRSEVELDTLTAKLVAAVDDTLQPEHVALWLKLPPGPAG